MLVITTPNIEGKRITKYYGLVSGEAILGANIFRDFFAGIRDIVGGRSASYEEELRKAKAIAVKEVEDQAQAMGANAVVAVEKIGDGIRFSISSDKLNDLEIDDSIAVNGCCLTAVAVQSDVFDVEAVEETLKKTTLSGFGTGTEVNLERAMRLSDRLGGHLVLGHVDGVGRILLIEERSTSWWVTVEIPPELERYLIHVGSIAIDGISLTIAELAGNKVSVSIIPHTWAVTTLAQRHAGELVNIEVDMIGKYVDKLLSRKAEADAPSRITEEFLKEKGFMHV